jgi:NAD dependent epimerase/dehydratase family enzyme
MIMSPDRGGIFDALLRLVRLGLGGSLGSGNQFVSWIHELDFVRAIDFLIGRQDFCGLVNVCSPNPLPNRDFMRHLREAWGMRVGLPSTEWMLEFGAILLRTETELVLKSRRVIPGRLLDAGFKFEFPVWPQAPPRPGRSLASSRRSDSDVPQLDIGLSALMSQCFEVCNS